MTFTEARNELKKLAGGKYYSLKFEYMGGIGQDEIRCLAYIDDLEHVGGDSWDYTINAMKTLVECGREDKSCTVDKTQFPDLEHIGE